MTAAELLLPLPASTFTGPWPALTEEPPVCREPALPAPVIMIGLLVAPVVGTDVTAPEVGELETCCRPEGALVAPGETGAE